jgi:hypothetical protein
LKTLALVVQHVPTNGYIHQEFGSDGAAVEAAGAGGCFADLTGQDFGGGGCAAGGGCAGGGGCAAGGCAGGGCGGGW